MKNKKFDPFKNLKLDSYEKEIEDAIDINNIVPVKNVEEEKKRYVKIFKEANRKDRHVSIRVNSQDLAKIQERAGNSGLPYQTLISTLLHQFASGKIRIIL